MNDILLINRLSSRNDSKEKKKIFFVIGDMNSSSIEDKLMDVINDSNLIQAEDMVLKYNGIELNIHIQLIPIIVELLAKEGFSIYGVYERYNPKKG